MLVGAHARQPHALVYPDSLRFLAAHALGLIKSTAFRGGGREVNADERVAALHALMEAPSEAVLAAAYPDVFMLQGEGAGWGVAGQDGKVRGGGRFFGGGGCGGRCCFGLGGWNVEVQLCLASTHHLRNACSGTPPPHRHPPHCTARTTAGRPPPHRPGHPCLPPRHGRLPHQQRRAAGAVAGAQRGPGMGGAGALLDRCAAVRLIHRALLHWRPPRSSSTLAHPMAHPRLT